MTIAVRVAQLAVVACALAGSWALAADPNGLNQTGDPGLKFAGPLAFGPEGVLLVGDPMSAAVYAFATDEGQSRESRGPLNVQGIDQKVAALLGTTPDQILINDLAVSPTTGLVYLSVARGRGPDALPAIVQVDYTGGVSEFQFDQARWSKAPLPNAPAAGAVDRRGTSQRQESITDLAFVDDKVIIAGLSNEEFASKLRAIPFPFAQADAGTSVEIYHGSHGAFETRSPIRTFVPYTVDGEACILAAYTCTPLVKFPVSQLEPGAKVMGQTIAELGNRNRPLDMIVYSQGDADYLLMANSARGVMKIDTDDFADAGSITERVPDKAGVSYETIDRLQGVQQLDRFDDANALVLLQGEDGSMSLQTVPLP